MSASQWDCRLHISSAHYRRTRQFLKAEEFQRNSIVLIGKYNKEYCLHVVYQFCMVCKTLSLCLSLRACMWDKATVCRALHTRVYVRQIGALRIHWDERKNSTDRLTVSELLKRSVSVFCEWKYVCAKLILSLQLTHWRVKSENLLASG